MAHRTRCAVAGLAIAVASGALATPGAADDASVSVTGTIEVLQADMFSANTSETTYELHRPGQPALEIEPDSDDPDLVTGQQVRVTGELDGTTLTEATVTPLAAQPASEVERLHTVAVLLVSGKNSPAFPAGYKQGVQQALSAANGVDHYYRVSSDQHVGFSFEVFDPIALTDKDKGCGNFKGWWNAVTKKAKKQGIKVDTYDHVVVAIPPRMCNDGWAGTATVGGNKVVVNASVPNFGYVAAHELGHNLTFQHASTVRCWQGVCWFNEYGDPFTVMGAGARTIHAQHAANVGWIGRQRVTTSGEYRIARLHSGRWPQSLDVRFPASQDTYNLEFRSSLPAFDNFTASDPAVNGVMIRWLTETDDGRPKTYTKLLDMQPSTTTLLDAPLLVNQTFASPWHPLQLTVKRIDTKGTSDPMDDEAVVQVTITGSGTLPSGSAPTAPAGLSAKVDKKGRVSLKWSKSTDDGKIARYEITRDGKLVKTNRRAQVTDKPGPGTHIYTIVAVDNDGNRSTPSAPLQVVVPT